MEAYRQTLDWLYSLEISKGIELKLERVRAALAELDDPQSHLRCIHVAGTNGKGSVVAFLSAILTAAGYRVGAYTSPHLVELTERIRIGAEEIERSQLVALADEVKRRVLDRGIGLTFFEVVTAIALLHLKRSQVDYAILEVGLGGRLDATNVVDPLAAVITSIGIDHTSYLGSTLAEIAFEKAGIVKPGRPLITGEIDAVPAQVIEDIAERRGAPIYRNGREYRWSVRADGTMDFEGMGWALERLEVGLAGRHQSANAATAVATLGVLAETASVSEAALRSGLRSVSWPGRMEVVGHDPLTILDGAHNVDAMSALVPEVLRIAAERPLRVLFAAMGDKDWPTMVEALAPHCASAVVTEVIPDRAVPAERLRDAFSGYCATTVEADPDKAFERARSEASPGEVVLVSGSLFLVGAVHRYLRDRGRVGADPR